jgi:hypothetical protein
MASSDHMPLIKRNQIFGKGVAYKKSNNVIAGDAQNVFHHLKGKLAQFSQCVILFFANFLRVFSQCRQQFVQGHL